MLRTGFGRLGAPRPRPELGVAVAVVMVTAATAAIYLLKQLAPVVSLSVVYLLAVLLVSAYWGLVLGVATSLLSAAAFNFFHIPPTGHFTIADTQLGRAGGVHDGRGGREQDCGSGTRPSGRS
jgi:K+-sensing histidine kinase KdpD